MKCKFWIYGLAGDESNNVAHCNTNIWQFATPKLLERIDSQFKMQLCNLYYIYYTYGLIFIGAANYQAANSSANCRFYVNILKLLDESLFTSNEWMAWPQAYKNWIVSISLRVDRWVLCQGWKCSYLTHPFFICWGSY